MVWQDFWLANPVDGPNPYNPEMFMDNAKDLVKRIRNHPSIAISVQWEKETGFDSNEDSTVKCFKLEFPKSLSSVHFIKLTLKAGDKTISENFYWRGLEDGNYQALRDLPVVELENSTKVEKSGENWKLTTLLNNTSKHPVLMIRLKVVGKNSGERILPVFYSDNYVSLMPVKKRSLR